LTGVVGQDETACCDPPGPKKKCIIYGDPHSNSFDGIHNDFYASGEFWIVKSKRVKIQGRYQPTKITRGLSVTKEISLGGPFLKGHVLMVDAERATLDGKNVLDANKFPATFDLADGLGKVTHNDHGEILQPHRELGKDLRVLHFYLPEEVTIQVNQWTNPREGFFINVMVKMSRVPGIDGHCGNFNGNKADDDRIDIRKRIGTNGVAKSELIGFTKKTPIVHTYEGMASISDCPTNFLLEAHGECQAQEHVYIPSMGCLVQHCHDKMTA